MVEKVVCVWVGSEKELYQEYLSFDYSLDEPESVFGKDAALDYYDSDFLESWWFEKLTLEKINNHREDLLDAKYFFDELTVRLANIDLNKMNSILFLSGQDSINENLFDYNGNESLDKKVRFVFKKKYVTNK